MNTTMDETHRSSETPRDASAKAIEAFHLAEQGFCDRMERAGLFFDPAFAVEAGLQGAMPYLVAGWREDTLP